MKVALIHDSFPLADGAGALNERLRAARARGAELAVLPELPLDRWVPGTRQARDEDAEAPSGPRHTALADAARSADLPVLGGAIVRDPASGERFNRALLFSRDGRCLASYDKLHVPWEEGFWERDHYAPGRGAPAAVGGFPLRVGIQICSDLQRPQGVQLLSALGVELILAPRATPGSSHERWRTVIRADAITAAAFVVSVNRPLEREGLGAAGPSLAVAPDGRVIAESSEPLFLVELDAEEARAARRDYPGYLEHRAEVYARAWSEIAGRGDEP